MKYQVNKTTSNNFINLKINTFSTNYFKALRFNKIIHKKTFSSPHSSFNFQYNTLREKGDLN